MRRLLSASVIALALALPGAGAAGAQDQTLADIRQELSVLYVEIQRLKRELSTTGGAGSVAGGATMLERLDGLEAELVDLTAKTETLENRINAIVADGTNRIGDLEFRLVELEGGDVSALGETTTLGGELGAGTGAGILAPAGTDTAGGGATPELAVGEQFDFDQAQAAFDGGDHARAAELFATFTATYTGGPMTGTAHFMRGEALAASGDTAGAARAYLESFSGSPEGASAPEALFRLGQTLGQLGQVSEACISLREVAPRYPQATDAAARAAAEMSSLGCQ